LTTLLNGYGNKFPGLKDEKESAMSFLERSRLLTTKINSQSWWMNAAAIASDSSLAAREKSGGVMIIS
jgi:hypothetical protein